MKKIRCPQCGASAEYSAQNPYRPFCSQRCKMVDLGAWASDTYKIPGKSELPTGAGEAEEPPPSPHH